MRADARPSTAPYVVRAPNQTIGEQRVRINFNPATSERGGEIADKVREVKVKSAELITFCGELKIKDPRLASLAQTLYEEAAMRVRFSYDAGRLLWKPP